MKSLNLILITLGFINCYGAKDNEIKSGATSTSNATLSFDGKSAYKLVYADKDMVDVKVTFTQQDEVRSMQLNALSDSSATELSESDYYPRFLVTAQSGNVTCSSAPIGFSDLSLIHI